MVGLAKNPSVMQRTVDDLQAELRNKRHCDRLARQQERLNEKIQGMTLKKRVEKWLFR